MQQQSLPDTPWLCGTPPAENMLWSTCQGDGQLWSTLGKMKGTAHSFPHCTTQATPTLSNSADIADINASQYRLGPAQVGTRRVVLHSPKWRLHHTCYQLPHTCFTHPNSKPPPSPSSPTHPGMNSPYISVVPESKQSRHCTIGVPQMQQEADGTCVFQGLLLCLCSVPGSMALPAR